MSENSRNYFFWNEGQFEEAVKGRVCPGCEYFDPRTGCHTPDARGCALFRYLPELVIIAQHLPEPDVRRYAMEVGEHVRMDCANPYPGTPCRLHDTLACDFEKNLPAILEAVWEADRMLENRKEFKAVDVS